MDMAGNVIRSWWAFVLQGVLAIGVGLAAFLAPGPTLAAFVAVFAVYALFAGVFEIVGGLSMTRGPRWSLVLGGIAAIVLGALTLVSPQSTAVAVTLLVGIYAIATGVARTSAAYMLGGIAKNWVLALSGVISVIFGVLLVAAPFDGVLAVLWLIGYYAIFAGVLSIVIGLRLREVGHDVSALESNLRNATASTSEKTGDKAASH
jgi:uncharacterized membrane protein HdeD (DUF308 family)